MCCKRKTMSYNKYSTGILLTELFPYEIYMTQLSVFAGRNPEVNSNHAC